MAFCGVDIKGSEAIICLLNLNDGLFNLPDCRARKIVLSKPDTSANLHDFQFAFGKLMQDYKVSKIVIRERPTKGKFAGGAVGFKMEAAIQLIDAVKVELLSPTAIKEQIKRNPIPVPFNETGLKIFQESAFNTAYAAAMQDHYGVNPWA